MGRSIDDVLHIRRHEPTRLEGFVKALFAFAVTPWTRQRYAQRLGPAAATP